MAVQTDNLRRFGRFLIVGASCTVIQYAILIALVQLHVTSAAIASCVGFVLSASLNYLLNYKFTFASDSPHWIAAGRFAAVAIAGLLLTYVLMRIQVEYLALDYLIAQLITTGLVLASNFLLLSRWAYVPQRSKLVKSGGRL